MHRGTGRYRRQTILPEIATEGQNKLSSASVLVVGVGGLGLPAATYLAGAGIGSITVMDHDTIERHNLHRQVIYRESDVGRPKVEIASYHLQQLNSEITVNAINDKLSTGNVESLVASHDIVLDAADNFTTTYLLSDACKRLGKYLVAASILGNRGYLGIFCGSAPSYRAIFPSPPVDTTNCNEGGVLGTAVGTVALLQAQETIKLIVAPAQALVGKLLSVDLWDTHFSTMDFRSASEPENWASINVVSDSEIQSSDLLVDVRSLKEYEAEPVTGAIHRPLDSGTHLSKPIPHHERRVVFFCSSGNRARTAAEQFLVENQGAEVCIWLRS